MSAQGREAGLTIAARICFAESELRLTDCAAELHVARKRAALLGGTWLSQLRAYSSFTRSTSARAKRIRAMQWQDFPESLRELVVRFAANPDSVIDVCPRALHWGSVADGKQGRMVRARCSAKTSNVFYAVR